MDDKLFFLVVIGCTFIYPSETVISIYRDGHTDKSTLYLCRGESVDFLWTYDVTDPDTAFITEIRWSRDTPSTELIGKYTTAPPSLVIEANFDRWVAANVDGTNAIGMQLINAQPADDGEYYVTIVVDKPGPADDYSVDYKQQSLTIDAFYGVNDGLALRNLTLEYNGQDNTLTCTGPSTLGDATIAILYPDMTVVVSSTTDTTLSTVLPIDRLGGEYTCITYLEAQGYNNKPQGTCLPLAATTTINGRNTPELPAELPVISDVYPDYGPADGGTLMTLTGDNLDMADDLTIIIGNDLQCIIVFRNRTKVFALTAPVDENINTLSGASLPISVRLNGGRTYNSETVFTYKGNPKIERIHPLKTLRSGGTGLTVFGDNLNSVARPIMELTMIIKLRDSSVAQKENMTIYNSTCDVNSNQQMTCYTPPFMIPEGYAKPNRLSKRDAAQNSQNDDSLTFYISFKLDGVNTYENLSQVLPEYAELNVVYTEPTFHFTANEIYYQPGESIKFSGRLLDVGCTVGDYMIEIAAAICTNLTLYTNAVSCYPPFDKPMLKHDNDGEHPKIVIHIGLYISHNAGLLIYPSPLPLHIIVPSTIAAIVAIIIIIIVYCACKMRK